MLQGWLIRWRWHRRVACWAWSRSIPRRALLLALLGRRERDGGKSRPPVLLPRIRVRADEYGVRVTARTLPRVGRAEWVKVADHLANAWGCVRVAVTQPEPGPTQHPGGSAGTPDRAVFACAVGAGTGSLQRWDIGRDEYADPVGVRVKLCLWGEHRGSARLRQNKRAEPIIASLAPSPAAESPWWMGRVGPTTRTWPPRFFAMCGDDLREANRLFQRVNEVRRRRSQLIRAVLGVKNMWHVGPSVAWPLVVLVIDEAHTFFAEVKGDKELMALAAENRRLVEELVKKGRSVGIVTLLATQKSTGDAIPTAIRDVCPVALSFAQRTDEAAVAALGADIRQYPDANPVALQDPGLRGRGLDGRPGPTGLRAGADSVRERRGRGAGLRGDRGPCARPGGSARRGGPVRGRCCPRRRPPRHGAKTGVKGRP